MSNWLLIPVNAGIAWAQAALTVITDGYQHVTARLRLAAPGWLDVGARFRLRMTGFRDAVIRTRISVRGFLDAGVRLRLLTTAYRDAVVRFRLQVRTYRDATTRLRLSAQGYRDAVARLRISAGALSDAGLRFLVQVIADQFGRPVADVADGAWTNEVGSAVNLYASIDETTASDADYIQSSASPAVADETKIRLGALDDPLTGSGHILRVRYGKDATGGDRIDLVVTLYAADGTTVITSQTYTDIDALTTAEIALTGPEADAIPSADYVAGLVVGLSAVKA